MNNSDVFSLSQNRKYPQWIFILAVFAILAWFLFQAFYFALTVKYSVSPDEYYHFELSSIYYQSGAFLIQDAPSTYGYGAVSTIPFMYHFLMGKSLYVNFFDLDPLIFLRLLNIFIAVLSFIFSYLLVKEIYTNEFFILACLVVQFNLLKHVFLSAMVSYDNLTNLMAVSAIYGLVKFLKTYSRFYFGLFVSALLAGMLVKITFGPLAVILTAILCLNYKRLFQNARIWTEKRLNFYEIIWIVFIVILLGANINFYVTNLVKYHHVSPPCDRVLSYEDCLKSPVFARDESLEKTRHERDEISFIEFAHLYAYRLTSSIIEIHAHKYMGKSREEKIPYFLLMFFSGLIYLVRIKEVVANRYAVYMLTIALFYLGVLFYVNYTTYKELLVFGLALQGRYLFPVLVPVIASMMYPLFMSKNRYLNAVLLCVIGIVFVDGCFFHFLRNVTQDWIMQ